MKTCAPKPASPKHHAHLEKTPGPTCHIHATHLSMTVDNIPFCDVNIRGQSEDDFVTLKGIPLARSQKLATDSPSFHGLKWVLLKNMGTANASFPTNCGGWGGTLIHSRDSETHFLQTKPCHVHPYGLRRMSPFNTQLETLPNGKQVMNLETFKEGVQLNKGGPNGNQFGPRLLDNGLDDVPSGEGPVGRGKLRKLRHVALQQRRFPMVVGVASSAKGSPELVGGCRCPNLVSGFCFSNRKGGA